MVGHITLATITAKVGCTACWMAQQLQVFCLCWRVRPHLRSSPPTAAAGLAGLKALLIPWHAAAPLRPALHVWLDTVEAAGGDGALPDDAVHPAASGRAH